MPLKVCEIYDFTNLFKSDFTHKSVAMSVTWYILSFGFCSVAKIYDSQMVLRSIVYCKSMALYSYLEAGFIFIWSHFGRQKYISILKFQILQCKRVCNP
jgi:hypothetical protein